MIVGVDKDVCYRLKEEGGVVPSLIMLCNFYVTKFCTNN